MSETETFTPTTPTPTGFRLSHAYCQKCDTRVAICGHVSRTQPKRDGRPARAPRCVVCVDLCMTSPCPGCGAVPFGGSR